MTPTQRALTFGSYWLIGLGVLAVLLSPYGLTWETDPDTPADLLSSHPDFGGELNGWGLYSTIAVIIPAFGILTAVAVSRPANATRASLRVALVAQAVGISLAIVAGWATLMATKITFYMLPPPSVLPEAVFAFLLWSMYAAVGFVVAGAVRVDPGLPAAAAKRP